MRIQTAISSQERTYFGPELRPHFLLTEMNLRGSAIGAFIGPCQVKTEHLVDWEDRLANDHIAAGKMVHFIGEFFGLSLREGVLIQRLFMATALQVIQDACARSIAPGAKFIREGDDIFLEEGSSRRKLSVSIVTSSAVSQLFHAGINLDSTGAPVAAVGLYELGLKSHAWVEELLRRVSEELNSLEWACAKVRPVM